MVLSFKREVTIMPRNSATLILNDGDFEYRRSLFRILSALLFCNKCF